MRRCVHGFVTWKEQVRLLAATLELKSMGAQARMSMVNQPRR